MSNETLYSTEIQKTLEHLSQRIHDRFPKATLGSTCQTLVKICKESDATIEWIARPDLRLRALIIGFIVLAMGLVPLSILGVEIVAGGMGIADFFQMADAIVDGLVYIGAGFVFLVTFETRRKRKRVVEAVNRLRSLAHIIDAHQLTKDPDAYGPTTVHSPARPMTMYELGRYLDYCTEMLALIGKIAFLYIQRFPDPVATDAVNDLESLTGGISQKIWQKIMIIHFREGLPGTVGKQAEARSAHSVSEQTSPGSTALDHDSSSQNQCCN